MILQRGGFSCCCPQPSQTVIYLDLCPAKAVAGGLPPPFRVQSSDTGKWFCVMV